jgi:uncharacterized protein YjbI with pentapeptide repeats
MTREWLDTIGTILGAMATVAGAIIIPIFIFNASNKISESQLDAQLKAEDERSKQSTLQRYLDQMGTLIIDNDILTVEDDEARTLARARTATVIQRLDADGNRNVVRFLNEAGLTGSGQSSISLLAGADLRGAHLAGIDLSTMDLSGANLSNAILKDADLTLADLGGADLNHANLSEANFSGAELNAANLRHANLKDAALYQATLNDADLSYSTVSGNLQLVSLNGAALYGADLRDSALSGANLSDATLTTSILDGAELSGANLTDAVLNKSDLEDARIRGIFEDDFSDSSSGWALASGSETEPFVIVYQKGNLRLYNPPPRNLLHSSNPSIGSAIDDVSVEVDATQARSVPNDQDSSWGIICRADEHFDSYYQLGIYPDGRSRILKLENDEWKELAARKATDAVRRGTVVNHLRADCSGSTLALYVNGQKLLDAPEVSGFEPGNQSGLFVQDSGSGEAVDILFDNFVVMGPKAKGLP